MKNSFVLYTDYKQNIDCLSQKQKGDLLDAIFEYAEKMTDESLEVVLDDVTKMAFGFIKSQMKKDFDKYNEICEKRRIAGLKGGAPKGNKNASKQANGYSNKQNNQMETKQAKQADNDNDNDNDNDINIINRARELKVTPNRKSYGQHNRVMLSSTERMKLLLSLGEDLTNQAIAYLDNYKVDKGYMPRKDYSDFDAINSWVINAVKNPAQPSKNTFNRFEQNNYSKEELAELEEKLLEN